LHQFHKWLQTELKAMHGNNNGECTPHLLHVAHLVGIIGVEMRSFDCQDGQDNLGQWRWCMHSVCLPLPHQTKLVEHAIKEAKNVSATDWSEQLQTCLAVIRSSTQLVMSDKMADKNKILSIICSARERTKPHKHLLETQHESKHDQRFKTL